MRGPNRGAIAHATEVYIPAQHVATHADGALDHTAVETKATFVVGKY